MISKNAKEVTSENVENYLHDSRIRIGEEIRNIREEKGYSQGQLADIMKVSRTTISKIENGKFNFSIDYLSKFSLFLDFNISISTINIIK
ncbi:helix-turn-helix domain-containing protein [Flavobacterium sp. SLB02]|uniref:helix-turn-helix domain-containing protein n=1 Tax=Flavobacterium sp. SLB02 TaxID=2665645 RepID=UPI0012A9647E|nr:helix-turn-helix transcriptional regulator [Flavobacterium sp. SLB02]QGK73420.1 helix-turn-helix domain-containing protein [Flavobacterium sp. SLB02]